MTERDISWFERDTPDHPMGIDGFSLLHLGYGIIGVYVLSFSVLRDAEIILVLTALSVLWEACEAVFASCLGGFFGISDYKGDSSLNMSMDINLTVLGTLIGVFTPNPASYILGFVVVGLGIAWSVARWWREKNNMTVFI